MSKRSDRREFRRTAAVLASIDAGDSYVADMWRRTGFHLGSLYPTLIRLEREGLIESAFEDGPRPHRRRYRRVQP